MGWDGIISLEEGWWSDILKYKPNMAESSQALIDQYAKENSLSQ
jgi:hypothetical protein